MVPQEKRVEWTHAEQLCALPVFALVFSGFHRRRYHLTKSNLEWRGDSSFNFEATGTKMAQAVAPAMVAGPTYGAEKVRRLETQLSRKGYW
jgi:hypothetical protein